jgi:hypothetical protein
MLGIIQKKIINIYTYSLNFFKAYLPHIVFLVFAFQFLSFLNTLPYINIINKYYYYVVALLWIFANFLFKEYITNRRILISGIIVFIIAIVPVMLEQNDLSDILGFAGFILLFTYVVREIVAQRNVLK